MYICLSSVCLQELLKLHKHKLQLQQQQVATAAQNQQSAGTQPATHVQTAQANSQLTVAAPRPGPVLTGTTVTNLQVARLVNTKVGTL